MKLIIQIPCYNEENTLPLTIKDLPGKIEGIDTIEYLIVDDGSCDRTVKVARDFGVHHVVSFPVNRGLAIGFMAGIDACLRLGADVIVNTDGDNQYYGSDIAKLIKPILDGRAEVVVGDRQTDSIKHFSPLKKVLQKIGSWVVRLASKSNVADTTSGFRAYSREAAMRINLITEYSYTLETLIEAGRNKTAIVSVPVRTNEKLRESRLISNIPAYIRHSASTIIRTYTMFRPLKVFLSVSLFIFAAGFFIGIRYIYFYTIGQGAGHVQSLILASILLTASLQLALFGLLADAIAANRKINNEILYRVKKHEYEKIEKPSIKV